MHFSKKGAPLSKILDSPLLSHPHTYTTVIVIIMVYTTNLTPNALMSFGSSSSKYCAEVVRFSFVNSKSAGEERPKFMPISTEPRDATNNAHIATTLTRPLLYDSVEPLLVDEISSSISSIDSVRCGESVMVSFCSTITVIVQVDQGQLNR